MKTTFENECGDLFFNDLTVGDIFTAPNNYPEDMVFMVLEGKECGVVLSGCNAGLMFPIDDDEKVKKLEGNLEVRFV